MGEICASLDHIEVVKNRKTVLTVETLNFYAGEITALVGPNGAGKSTLLKVINGLETPNGGKVWFQGQIVNGRNLLHLRRRMAMVFQSPCLFQTTVYENIAAGLRIRKASEIEIKQSVYRWAERFGVEHLLERQARQLSGGESQRVALARAMACRPELFLLDEPFASLDPPTRETLCRELRAVIKEEGITAVVVTHAMEEVFLLADRTVMLHQGRVVQDGIPEDLLFRPVSEEVANFVGERRIMLGRVVGRSDGQVEIETTAGRFRMPTLSGGDGTVLVCIRESS